ncbi:hypothetical protein Pan44_06220 [Caulifigura coniformis]|uniref:Peptidase C-terminal archaeal/bacterial domain-containing protein n=1 Tax=Caulifigura coniformis TaxID=2527983 RepID=A0A517S903_9PLAN|nr:hypothetical protein [Caulifigura coniformis]QDT52610.1 hypothetical protein Pan44_06220 [Caulifigura coniformis]
MILLSVCLAWLTIAPVAFAELPWSRVDGLFPAGAKAGSVTRIRLTSGSELEATSNLTFSHPGITGSRVADSSPAENLFEVRVAPEVPPGLYDVALLGDLGLSNLRTFAVSTQDESTEAEPNETLLSATPAVLGAILNGRIGKPTDVDAYTFHATAGQRVIADCLASRIDSPLLPVMEILDARGRRIAFARSGRDEDATLVFEPPQAADYTLRVYDQTYRGGDDFVYRIDLNAAPYIVAVKPVFGKVGSTAEAQLLGFNLPAAQTSDQRRGRWLLGQLGVPITFPADPLGYDRLLPVTPREAATDSFSWRFESPAGSSQPVRMSLSENPPLLEVEPNQVRSQAQRLQLPAEIGGDFRTVGDLDQFQVDVVKDRPIWIEVFADRLGSRADAMLGLEFIPEGTNAPQTITSVDDNPTNLLPIGFDTRSDDPYFRFNPPANGTCLIQLRDQYGQTRGDATLDYRLVVRSPQPDFRLVAVPVSHGLGMVAPASLRRGDATAFMLVAFRRDGFDGPIEVPSGDLGGGLDCEGTVIPSGQTSAPLVIRSRLDSATPPRVIALTGRATIPTSGNVTTLIRPVRPAATIRNARKEHGQDAAAAVRLAREFVLSVSPEEAALELRSPAARHTAAQGCVIELPLELLRRAGAEAPVTISTHGLVPASKIDAANVTLAPGETSTRLRLTVRPDAPVQTVAFHVTALSKVQYQKNAIPRRDARLALDEITQRLKEAGDQAKIATAVSAAATQALETASKSATENSTEIASLEAARAAAAQKATEALNRVTQLETDRAAAEKRVHELDQPARELEITAVSSPLVINIVPPPIAVDIPAGKDVALPVGQSTDVVLKLTRQNGYTGPAEIELYVPGAGTGVSAATATAAPDVTELKLTLQAAPDASPGARSNVTIRARCGPLHVDAPIQLKVVP